MLRRFNIQTAACLDSSSQHFLLQQQQQTQLPLVTSSFLINNTCGLKTRKRPKVGAPYIKESQTWREDYQSKQQRLLADSLRAYVTFGNNKRINPWDSRFKPFNREETDGVYVVMRYLMKDKLDASRNHAAPVKKLMANVGLIGPQVTTTARWRNMRSAAMSEKATLMSDRGNRDKTVRVGFFSD